MRSRRQDGKWEITPHKIWELSEESGVTDVRAPMASIEIPSKQQDLTAIIQFAMKSAEDVTGMPLLMQGQQGAAPDTVGGMTMLQNNASTVLRRLARTFDDMITVPHITRYYDWLLQYGDEKSEKGDFSIIARGSSALFERDAQNQFLMQVGNLVSNPSFGIDPKKYLVEILKSRWIDRNGCNIPKRNSNSHSHNSNRKKRIRLCRSPRFAPRAISRKRSLTNSPIWLNCN